MAAQPDQQIVFGFDGGIVEGAIEDVVQPPNMITSTNTRFSVLRGVPTKPPERAALSSISWKSHGLIPSGNRENTAWYSKLGTYKTNGDDVRITTSTVNASAYQNGYIPLDLTDAGVLQSGGALVSPPVVVESSSGAERTWAAVIKQRLATPTPLGTWAIFITVMEGNQVVIPGQNIIDVVYPYAWFGLTAHGANGMRLWYHKTFGVSPSPVYVRSLTLDNSGVLTVGAETLVYTPLGTTTPSVIGGDSQYAWLATRHSATVGNVAISRVNITTYALTTLSQAFNAGATADIYLALARVTWGGSDYLALASSEGGASLSTIALYNGQTMAVRWSSTGRLFNGPCAVAFQSTGATLNVIYGVSDTSGVLGASSQCRTEFESFSSTGVYGSTLVHNWEQLHGGAASWVDTSYGSGFIVPLFQLVRAPIGPTVIDPAIRLCTVFTFLTGDMLVAPLARFAVDTAHIDAVASSGLACSNSISVEVDGSAVVLSYLESRSDGSSLGNLGYVPRYVRISLAEWQPRYAVDSDGLTYVAAAQPVTWDAVETVEFGAINVPMVVGQASGGTGVAYSGTNSFIAVIEWRDFTGQFHRSAPSAPISITAAASSPMLRVAIPFSMRTGLFQDELDIHIYATASGGTVYYRQGYYAADKNLFGAWVFASIADPGSSGALLYSTGAPGDAIVPEAPPALWDIAIVGNRGWGIPAERRGEAIFTKQKQSGIALEFAASVLRVVFPAEAGKLVAVSEANGNPVFFAERGIYLVFGDGPTNTGIGSYGQPKLLSSVGCTERGSVVKTPAGVMFQTTGDTFAILTAAGAVQYLSDVEGAGTIVSAVCLPEDDEVLFVRRGDQDGLNFKVYNYALDRWSNWSLPSAVLDVKAACALPTSRSKMLFVDYTTSTTGSVNMLDVSLASSSTQAMDVKTGKIFPAGPQGEVCIRDVVIKCRRLGAHGLSVTVTTEGGTITRTWSSATLDTLGASGEYTIAVEPSHQSTRWVQVRALEVSASTAGVQPVSCTIVYGAVTPTKRDLPPSARQ